MAYYELGAFMCFVLCVVNVFRGTAILCVSLLCVCVCFYSDSVLIIVMIHVVSAVVFYLF